MSPFMPEQEERERIRALIRAELLAIAAESGGNSALTIGAIQVGGRFPPPDKATLTQIVGLPAKHPSVDTAQPAAPPAKRQTVARRKAY